MSLRHFVLSVAIALGVAFLSPPASAQQWDVQAHVTVIEPSNVGATSTSSTAYGAIYFQLDQAGGSTCPAGTWIYWAPRFFFAGSQANEEMRQMANTKAMLSTLQLAMALGTKVRVFGNDISVGACQAVNVWQLTTP